jgi:acyl carrier protein
MTTEKLSHEDVNRVVYEQIVHQLARIPGNRTADLEIGDQQTLEGLGFGSLDLLELVDGLETALLVNPFEQGLAVTDIRTVRDLCGAYHRALSVGVGATDGNDPALLASRRRGAVRRRRQTR